MSNTIEIADFGTVGEPASRIAAACSSAVEFYNNEIERLRNERRLYDEELAKTDDPGRIDELNLAIQKNIAERIKFEKAWEKSSLRRRYLMGTRERAEMNVPVQHFAGAEKRIATMTSDRLRFTTPKADNKGGQTKKLTGYAAKYNSDSTDLGGFIERIAPGAFDEVVKSCDCRFLVNHSADLILGRTTNKSLRLYSDRIGLLFFNDLLPGDVLSEGAIARVERGDWSQCSFCFVVGKDRWEFAKRPDGFDLRIIEEISELLDISVVTYPAYKNTTISVIKEPIRSLDTASSVDIYDDLDEEYDRFIKNWKERQLTAKQGYDKAGRIINRIRLGKIAGLDNRIRELKLKRFGV